MGEWRDSPVGYLEPYHVVCDLCGQLVPTRYWQESIEGTQHIFCSPDHAQRYETYWLPLYGATGAKS